MNKAFIIFFLTFNILSVKSVQPSEQTIHPGFVVGGLVFISVTSCMAIIKIVHMIMQYSEIFFSKLNSLFIGEAVADEIGVGAVTPTHRKGSDIVELPRKLKPEAASLHPSPSLSPLETPIEGTSTIFAEHNIGIEGSLDLRGPGSTGLVYPEGLVNLGLSFVPGTGTSPFQIPSNIGTIRTSRSTTPNSTASSVEKKDQEFLEFINSEFNKISSSKWPMIISILYLIFQSEIFSYHRMIALTIFGIFGICFPKDFSKFLSFIKTSSFMFGLIYSISLSFPFSFIACFVFEKCIKISPLSQAEVISLMKDTAVSVKDTGVLLYEVGKDTAVSVKDTGVSLYKVGKDTAALVKNTGVSLYEVGKDIGKDTVVSVKETGVLLYEVGKPKVELYVKAANSSVTGIYKFLTTKKPSKFTRFKKSLSLSEIGITAEVFGVFNQIFLGFNISCSWLPFFGLKVGPFLKIYISDCIFVKGSVNYDSVSYDSAQPLLQIGRDFSKFSFAFGCCFAKNAVRLVSSISMKRNDQNGLEREEENLIKTKFWLDWAI